MDAANIVRLSEEHLHTVEYDARPVLYTDKPLTIRIKVQEGPCTIEELLPARIEAGYFHHAFPVPSLAEITSTKEQQDISHLIHQEDASHLRPLLPVYFPRAV